MLAASVRLELSESRRVVVVTSAHAGDERAPVVAGLGRALTGSGVPTLLVSADLRHPMLHKELDVPPGPGVGEVLDRLERDPAESADELIAAATRAHERPGRGELRALPSGDPSQHPGGAALRGGARNDVLGARPAPSTATSSSRARRCSGPIDGQLVARWADAVLVVCHLDRLSPDDATELGDVVARLDAPVLGAVLVGGTSVRYSLPLVAAGPRDRGLPGARASRRRASRAAQIRAAKTHRWRQWSVSMTALLASSPHHAASSAAEPMPCVLRPATALRSAGDQREAEQRQQREQPRVALLPQRSRVRAVGRDVGDRLELARPRPERVLLGGLEPRALAAEALGVIGLRARPLREEVAGAGRHHDRGHDHARRRPRSPRTAPRPCRPPPRSERISPSTTSAERRGSPTRRASRRTARRASRIAEQHGLGRPAAPTGGAECTISSIRISAGGIEERPEDVRVLEEGPAAVALRQQLVRRAARRAARARRSPPRRPPRRGRRARPAAPAHGTSS